MSKDEALRDLIERVERSQAPDRVLDAEIAIAIKWPPMGRMISHWVNEEPLVPVQEGLDPHHYLAGHVCMKRLPDNGTWETPAYTGSMDAVLTLIDPGDEWELSTIYNIARATVGLNRDHQTAWPGYGEHKAGNPVLALLSASLRAHMGTGG